MAVNFGGFLIKAYGAYIRTDISGLLDITGTASGVIGMVGLAEKGPVNEPVTVTSYIQLVNTFGDGPLVRHALAAYVGGASTVVCIRTGNPTGASLTAITVGGTPQALDYTWRARELGTLGDNISVATSESGDNYTIRIRYVDERGNDIRETFVTPPVTYLPPPTPWAETTSPATTRGTRTTTSSSWIARRARLERCLPPGTTVTWT